ncbi:hypothetical protein [Burkholderia diffusa]|uniref:hypothetical protein n=1 Tax=Burkholderia diffusa TaxID=488732 RepID=UPI00084149AC|nr:hypothetical protein [Burkholderia diffusa]AOI57445.1 hypothetical protein WI26_07415 [Burkholderia diffusa]
MANNNFKAFAGAANANVMTQADYEALSALLTGFQSGTAQSQQLNKVWRQSSIMAAVLAQFIVDLSGQDAIDDGTTATLLTNLKAAIQAQSAAVVGQARNVSMSVAAASSTATFTADEIVVGSALGGKKYVLGAFNKTVNLTATGAGGMDAGSAPANGFVALYAIYNPTTQATALLATNATSAAVPNVYSAGNAPAGYTASALVSVWPTSSNGQFIAGYQVDRQISLVTTVAASTTSQITTLTALTIAVPKNARTISGWASVNSLNGVNAQTNVSGSASTTTLGIGLQQIAGSSTNSGVTSAGSFNDIPLITPQTVYWSSYLSSGTFNQGILYLSKYTF